MKRLFFLAITSLLVFSCTTTGKKLQQKSDDDLIPRRILFGNPQKVQLQLSPDGTKLSYLAPSEKNVLNVWVKSVGKQDDRMVTKDENRGIRAYGWAYNGEQIIYIQDKEGDENWHLYATDLEAGSTKDLTPFDGVRAQNFITHREHPDRIYVGLNKRNRTVFDMYRLNLRTGELKMVAENPGDVAGWMTDNNFILRVSVAQNPENSDTIVRIRADEHSEWRDLITFPFGENGGPVAFTADNSKLYLKSTLESDKARLVLMDIESGEIEKVVAEDERVDIGSVMKDPVSHKIVAVGVNYLKPEIKILDDSVKKDFEYLSKLGDGLFFVTSADLKNRKWIVAYMTDDAPYRYYHYDRDQTKARFIFSHQPALEKYKLAKMKPVVIKTRDGLEMVSYLTLPPGKEVKNLPMVLHPHGGPWHRDSWGMNAVAQWLANRGYAVLMVNFRGSTGFGKSFVNAGNKEWGRKMQDDLTDAVKWAINEGIADPKRVAIMGGSYGGYATLAGLAFTPDLYACGVDIVGVSHLKTFFKTIPPYWKTFKKELVLRIGDAENDEELNKERSPLHHADKIKKPLLIAQGKNDPRVNIEESNQMVTALRERNLTVEYIVYPDEGHGFARPENKLDFFGRTEEFLKKYLGGKAEPWKKIKGSSGEEK